MKREEKNQQTQRRIMDSALAEFAEKGHGGSSVNTICAAQGISKGIIYHYFENKDELYLACVEECFQRLTAHLSAALPEEDDGLPPLPSAEAEAIDRDGQLSLLRRIHALPEPGREVVYLRTFGGLSFREIGEVLGRTETWARVTFYRGKEALRKGGADHEEHS